MPKSKPESYVLPVLGMVLLVLPACMLGRWIRVFATVSGHDARVAEFSSILPRVLQDPVASTLFLLACSVAAAGVGAIGLVRSTGLRRWIGAATLASGGLLSLGFASSLL